MKLPSARENLIVQDLTDEVLIYNLTVDKSYCLNSTAKTVFNACDGKTTIEDLKSRSGLSEEIIYLSLDELERNNLLQANYDSPLSGINRREVIKKVGLASMIALPVIVGLTAPKAIQAASQRVCFNAGGAPAGQRVFVAIENQTNNTNTNQNAAGRALSALCCNNAYEDFRSNGCSDGDGAICNANALCI